MKILKVGWPLTFIFLAIHLRAQEIKVQLDPNKPDYGQVAVWLNQTDANKLGNPQVALDKLLKIHVGHQKQDHVPQVIGKYTITNQTIVFQPKYPPPPGIKYRISFEGDLLQLESKMKLVEFLSPKTTMTSQVIAIFPSADTLPSNVLRFYIHFNRPMRQQNPGDYITIRDEQGNIIHTPFVDITSGLWNPDRTRLTLLIHPGRIKRGVGPNSTMGTVFENGNMYTMTIDSLWKDINGQYLSNSFTKSFQTSSTIRTRIAPKHWDITYPIAGSNQSLMIKFDRAMDRALVRRSIHIVNEKNKEIKGEIKLNDQECTWIFEPKIVWARGDYTINIDKNLEDVCGNSTIRAFETGSSNESLTHPISIAFTLE